MAIYPIRIIGMEMDDILDSLKSMRNDALHDYTHALDVGMKENAQDRFTVLNNAIWVVDTVSSISGSVSHTEAEENDDDEEEDKDKDYSEIFEFIHYIDKVTSTVDEWDKDTAAMLAKCVHSLNKLVSCVEAEYGEKEEA